MSRRKADPIARVFDSWLMLDPQQRKLFQAMIQGHERTLHPEQAPSRKRKPIQKATQAMPSISKGDLN